MGIERVTPHPDLYLEELKPWEAEAYQAEEDETWSKITAGKFWVTADLRRIETYLSTSERRKAAHLIGNELGATAVFDRREDCYRIDQ